MLHSLRLLRAQRMAAQADDTAPSRPLGAPTSSLITPRARADLLQRLCQSVCRLHDVILDASGRFPDEPVIYVGNHLGYVDPIAICSLTPCSPIAKLEVASWPVVGKLTQQMNVIFVRRGDPNSGARALRLAARRLEAGVNVLNFPEGTTTRGDVREFQRGVFGIARRLGVAVVPLALSFETPALCWVDDDRLVSHYARTLLGAVHRVQLEVGPRMYARGHESAVELAERARRWIVAARARHETRLPPFAYPSGVRALAVTNAAAT